jgi:hypothetical protein
VVQVSSYVTNRLFAGTWSSHVIAPSAAFSKVNIAEKDAEVAAAALVPFLSASHLLNFADLLKGTLCRYVAVPERCLTSGLLQVISWYKTTQAAQLDRPLPN